jgi:hypothetical protein
VPQGNSEPIKPDPLRNARAKLARAEEHAEVLKTEWRAFVDTNPYGIEIKRQADVVEVFFQVLKHVPIRLLTIVGDMLHNLRAALDYTAVAMVHAHGGDVMRGGFPIYLSESHFIKDVRCRKKGRHPGPLNGVPTTSEEFAFIERLQPYQRGDDKHADPLYALAFLSNRDKHRMLNPGYGGMVGEDGVSILRWPAESICVEAISFWQAGMPLRDGTKLARLRFDTAGAYPEMAVKEPLTIEIFFPSLSEDGTGPRGAGFASIRAHVAKIVKDAEVFFLKGPPGLSDGHWVLAPDE